jgi:hypothetical protein
MIKLRYEAFWPGLNPNDFFITKFFENYTIVNDNSYDLLICSVFLRNNIINLNNTGKILLFNGEHPSYITNFIINSNIKPDILMGFTDIDKQIILNIYGNNKPIILYYPLWILYYDNIFSQQYFDEKNNYIKNITKEEFNERKFCCLINSHDNNNSRTPIYNFIIKNNKSVDCPGLLLNNIDSKLVGKSSEDKLKFMQNYKFNICSENKYGYGYVTEKMPQSMDSTAIPIYIGCDDLNKINFKIFNKDRIIFIKNINDFDNLKLIINNMDKAFEIFKRPIFNNDSFKILQNHILLTKKILIKICSK